VAVLVRISLLCRWVSSSNETSARVLLAALFVQLLVAVLMAVRCQLLCILLRLIAMAMPTANQYS
jgi:hypothetical protein